MTIDDDVLYDKYDAACDAYERRLQVILRPMVRKEVHRRMEILANEHPDDEDCIDERSIYEQVEQEFRPEAERILAGE